VKDIAVTALTGPAAPMSRRAFGGFWRSSQQKLSDLFDRLAEG